MVNSVVWLSAPMLDSFQENATMVSINRKAQHFPPTPQSSCSLLLMCLRAWKLAGGRKDIPKIAPMQKVRSYQKTCSGPCCFLSFKSFFQRKTFGCWVEKEQESSRDSSALKRELRTEWFILWYARGLTALKAQQEFMWNNGCSVIKKGAQMKIKIKHQIQIALWPLFWVAL